MDSRRSSTTANVEGAPDPAGSGLQEGPPVAGPDPKAEYQASLALKHVSGLGARTWKRLLERFGSAAAAVRDPLAWPEEGLASRRQAESCLAGGWRAAAEEEDRARRLSGARVLLWSDPAYPFRLRAIPDPPLFLYWRGDKRLLDGPGVALVGARHCSRYGLDVAWRFGEELSAGGVTVISGLALGIDRQAHLAGLTGPGGSIAVLGSGVDVVYPPQNRDLHAMLAERGLLLSELAPGAGPEARHFPARNRIISGLSLGVMVVEAAAKSGSLITARLAAEQGREVFAPPGLLTMPTFAGCHALIRQGATLVESAQDILQELEPLLRAEFLGGVAGARPAPPTPGPKDAPGASEAAPPPRDPAPVQGDLDDEERRLVGLLDRESKTHIDDLARRTGLAISFVSRKLLLLEIRGLVRKWSGMFYSR